jgi:hypothetical protein
MKKIIILSLTILIVNSSFSQDSKFIHSLKYGMFTEYQSAPASVILIGENFITNPITFQNEPIPIYGIEQNTAVSILNVVYTLRYNAYEPSDNIAIGINAAPSFGLSISNAGFGSINVPAFVSLDFGAGSTYSTSSGFGGFIGIGYEFTKIGLFGSGDEPQVILSNTVEVEEPKSAWTEPMFITGIRWWTKRDRLMELSFKYGFGSNGDLNLPAGSTLSGGTPRTIQIVWGMFLGY